MQKHYDRYLSAVEEHLQIYLPNIPLFQAGLSDAMRYSLLAPGKRLRPVLLLEFYRQASLLKGESDWLDAMPFACALEMVHTYSLIHDDLPCMDDDDTRRGQPTNHIVFGEANALLAGSALLSAAFETCLENTKNIPPDRVVRAANVLASASGLYGMAGGQHLDLQVPATEPQDLSTVTKIHELKTGALISAAAEIGCILAGADTKTINHATSFAHAFGMVFQIIDDLLDVDGDPDVLGKPTGSDVLNNKLTFVRLLGAQKSRELAETFTQEAVEFLKIFPDPACLTWIAETMLYRTR